MGGNLPLNRKCVTMPHMLQAARVRRIPKGRETMEQNNKNRPDPNGKKKYYIFYPQIWGSKRWTWYDTSDPDNPAYVYESLGTTNAIGSGKTNTDIVMAADSGAYVTNNSNGVATVWYIIQQMRDGNYGGCNDWFLASRAELEELRLFMNAHPEVLTELNITNWFSNNYIWSSAENSAQNAWNWNYNDQNWNNNNKNNNNSVCGVRVNVGV